MMGRQPFNIWVSLYLILTTILILIRLEKAAKAEKEESSELENPREHLNQDQAELVFK